MSILSMLISHWYIFFWWSAHSFPLLIIFFPLGCISYCWVLRVLCIFSVANLLLIMWFGNSFSQPTPVFSFSSHCLSLSRHFYFNEVYFINLFLYVTCFCIKELFALHMYLKIFSYNFSWDFYTFHFIMKCGELSFA